MWIWFAIFIVLAVIEGITCSLVSIWFCVGALAGIVTAAYGAPAWAQLIVFVLVSGTAMYFLRSYVKKRIAPYLIKTNFERLGGMLALAIEDIDHVSGAVKVEGKEWNANTNDEDAIPAGQPCKIIKMDGNKLIVTADTSS